MLRELLIRNFAIIDRARLEMEPGMTALTGETGAGKSILVDALGLLLGDRASSDLVRHGQERAEVAALFDLSALPGAVQWLADQALDDGSDCRIRRTLYREGKSRAYINDSPVTLQRLRELGRLLVDIHGQHEHQSLVRPDVQRALLDAQAGLEPAVAELGRTWRAWRDAERRLEDLRAAGRDRTTRMEYLRYQLDELAGLELTAADIEALDAEQRRLSHAGTLLEQGQRLLQALYEDDEGSAHGRASAVARELEEMERLDPGVAPARELVQTAVIQLAEAADELRAHLDGLTLDPQRLQQVEELLARLHRLARKHQVPAAELPALAEALQEELAGLERLDSDLGDLEREVDALARRYREQAGQLHAQRRAAARPLAEAVTGTMQDLGMPGGRFEIAVEANPEHPAAQGWDRVEFRVSANPGQPPMPLARVASGGELSRISLAVQVMAPRGERAATLIFDEVDTGIGGGVAETVGLQLRRLGGDHQVLCVTHLPQVAAQAHHHLRVTKHTAANSTRTEISRLSPVERVEEIARMLGGRRITRSTRAHAAEMLEQG